MNTFDNAHRYTSMLQRSYVFLTAIIAAFLGTTLAVLARRTNLLLRRMMDTLVWIVFFFPSFLNCCAGYYSGLWLYLCLECTYLEYIGIGGPNGIQFYGTIWLLFCAFIGGNLVAGIPS